MVKFEPYVSYNTNSRSVLFAENELIREHFWKLAIRYSPTTNAHFLSRQFYLIIFNFKMQEKEKKEYFFAVNSIHTHATFIFAIEGRKIPSFSQSIPQTPNDWWECRCSIIILLFCCCTFCLIRLNFTLKLTFSSLVNWNYTRQWRWILWQMIL